MDGELSSFNVPYSGYSDEELDERIPCDGKDPSTLLFVRLATKVASNRKVMSSMAGVVCRRNTFQLSSEFLNIPGPTCAERQLRGPGLVTIPRHEVEL